MAGSQTQAVVLTDRENIHDLPDIPINTKEETLLSYIFYTIGHVVVGVFVSWLIGFVGLNMGWALLIFFPVVYRMERNRQSKLLDYRFRELERIRKEKLQQFSLDESKEKVEWVNTFLSKMWPKMNKFIRQMAQEKVKEIVGDIIEKKKLPYVKGVELKEIRMGSSAPEITFMKAHSQLPDTTYKLDVAIRFVGELEIVAQALLEGKYFAVKFPVNVKDIDLQAKFLIKIELCDWMPFVHTVEVNTEHLDIDLSVKPLMALDLMDIPLVHSFTMKTVSDVLKEKPIVVRLSQRDLSERNKKDQDQVVSVDTPKQSKGIFKKISSAFGGSSTTKEAAKPIDQIGVIKVRLIEGRNLIAADKGFGGATSDPYCVLKYLGQELKSNVKKKDLDPKWNQKFEFKVDRNDNERKLFVTVFDWDQFGSNDFLGMTAIEFRELQADGQSKEQWLTLLDKDGSQMQSGEIHLEVAFYLS